MFLLQTNMVGDSKMANYEKWVLCPICENKTRDKIRPDTIIKNFPLFCSKCKNESLIDVKQLIRKRIIAVTKEKARYNFDVLSYHF